MIKSDTQTNIARRTILSQATVSTAVRELARDGIVRNDKTESNGRGTKVSLLPAAGAAVAIGVDLGFNHTTVIARRVDRSHEGICVRHSSDGANRGLQDVLPQIKHMIDDAVEETGLRRESVVSLGIAVPRMVNPRTNKFTRPVLPPWKSGDDPAKDLGEHLGVTAALDNDANLGALAEQTYGTSEGVETVVYVKASTGIGTGLIVGNSLIRGHMGMAGEIGHLTIDRGGAVCLCGGRGCLETIIGAEALIAQVKQSRGKGADMPHTLDAIIGQARAGDAVCRRVVEDAGRTLGVALAQLCSLLNPDLIVLGGPLAAAGPLVLDRCRESLRRFALAGAVDPDNGFVLRTSSLGELAEAQGALILGLSQRATLPT